MLVFKIILNFSLIFMQDLGNNSGLRDSANGLILSSGQMEGFANRETVG
jgi:hypothetical protein